MKIALFFGGMSPEYEISLRSAAAILRALTESQHEVFCVGITRGGEWLLTEATPGEIEQDAWQGRGVPCLLSPDRGLPGLWFAKPGEPIARLLPDVLLPALHGRYGEDGCIQGLFALSGIPFVGCDTRASAIAMDKGVAKTLLAAAGVPVVPFLVLRGEALHSEAEARAAVERRLLYPVFVKPLCGGSSIGAGRVDSPRALWAQVEEAAGTGDDVLVESFISARELEVAAMRRPDGSLFISPPGEVMPPKEDFYSYAAKYEGGGAKTTLSPHLPSGVLERIRQLSARVYTTLSCRAGVRIDFFLCRRTGRLYLNEVNTLPGFTEISMFPLLAAEGRPLSHLLDELIAGARLP